MITLDDKYRLEDFGLRAYLEHEHEAVPEIRRKIMTIPGRPGALNFGSEIGERHFNLPLKVNEDDQVTLRQKLRDFVAFLFDEYGSPRPIKLSFDYEPDKYYTVEVSSLVTPGTEVYHFLNFGLPLIASDPFAYSIVDSNEITWGSEKLTFSSISYTFGHEGSPGKIKITSPTTLKCEVVGLAVEPIIEISGSANGLTLSNNSQSFTLKNFTNTDWRIDTKIKTVMKNNKNAFDELEGDFLLFKTGINELSITGSNLDIELNIKYRDKYL